MEVVRYFHAVNTGDLIAALPGIRQVWRETGKKGILIQRLDMKAYYYDGATHPVVDKEGNQVCMNEKQWAFLTPLLEAQEYIAGCAIYKGQQTDINLNIVRESAVTPQPNGSLYWYLPLVVPQMACDFSEPFLNVEGTFTAKIIYSNGRVEYTGDHKNKLANKVIISRSERYMNPLVTYFFLKEFTNRFVFAGTEKEHKKFCEEWELDIPLLVADNFLEIAQAINASKAHISNQTAIYHLSEGLKKRRYLEVCAPVANVWPNGKNGFAFMHQITLEYYIRKLMAE
jgi:hypothetical protein